MDAVITAMIAISRCAASVKAKLEIKMATVNPIPAALPVANTSELRAPEG
jgi:hypothetical protein